MAVLYSIRDWDRHFEVAQSRKIDGPLKWLPMPCKHDGLGFRRIMAMENGPAIYGAWVLILQVAAKCETRGVLMDENGPLDANDLAAKTGCPAAVFSTALNVLLSKKIGWIVGAEWEQSGSAVALQDRTEQDRTEQNNTGAASPPLLDSAKKVPPASDDPTKPPPPPAKAKPLEPRAEDIPIPAELETPEFIAARDAWFAQRRRRRFSMRSEHILTQYERLRPLGAVKAAECLRWTVAQDYQGLFPERVARNPQTRQQKDYTP